MSYPPDWPKCALCELPRLDGHLTCGRLSCSESQARDVMRARSWHEPAPAAAPRWLNCRSLDDLDDEPELPQEKP